MERPMSEEFSYVQEGQPHDDGRAPLALALGLAAALAAGGLWAMLVYITNMEIGYAAIAVGFLVGFAMTRATTQRTSRLAYAAAAFALIGLVAGKAFIFATSSGQIAKQVAGDAEIMKSAAAWQMYEERTLDQQTLAEVDRAEAEADTLSDATWHSMVQQAESRLAGMTDEERQQLAGATAGNIMDSMGMAAGIQAQLSMFDMLWVLFAVGTAYRMLAPAREPEAADAQV
jgi:hypothetical protein